MMTHLERMAMFGEFGLTQRGKDWVTASIAIAPSRPVQSTGSNQITEYQSKKMDRDLRFESHTVEYRAGLLYEYDPKVLEYYAQPKEVEFRAVGPDTGKLFHIRHTPDFLVVSDHAVYVDEWKPEARLAQLAKRQPDRFIKDQGVWRSRPLEDYFRPMGINYRVRSSSDIPRLRVANLEFLASYLDRDCPKVPRTVFERVKALFQDRTDILLSELLEMQKEPNAGFTIDDVYKMVADGDLMIDLDLDEIYETERLRIYRDAAALQLVRIQEASANGPLRESLSLSLVAGARVGFDDRVFEVLSTGTTKVLLKTAEGAIDLSIDDLERMFQEGRISIVPGPENVGEGGDRNSQLMGLSPEVMKIIVERMDLIVLEKSAPHLVVGKKRTIQRYKRAMRNAGDSLIDQHLALAPKKHKQGNRTQQISDEVLNLIKQVAKDYYNTATGPTRIAAYREFTRLCQESSLHACSIKTFQKRVEENVTKREGRKRGYQEGEIVWYLEASVPIHGVRPFQFVHIDCTPLELVVIDPKTRKVLGTVWLCLALDAESRREVGFILTFERPSARTTLMVLRDIVRKHGRLPETVIVDWGPENVNDQFQRFCRIFKIHIRQRPKGQPRAGSVLERLFGTTHTQFIHLMEGNTKVRKHHRMVTKAVRPENFATWTLVALHGALQEYFDELYGKNPHKAHGLPPIEYFNRRLVETGERRHRMVRYDRLLKIETCPEPLDGPVREVNRHRGIKVGHIWFWSVAFKGPGMDGQKVQVRIDPWDPGAVFALVGSTWVDCISKYRKLLSGLTTLQLRYELDAIRKRLGPTPLPLTAERVGEWVHALDPKNFDPRLASEQSEMRKLYEALDMAGVLTPSEGGSGHRLEVIEVDPIGSDPGATEIDLPETEPAPIPSLGGMKSNPKKQKLDDDYPLL